MSQHIPDGPKPPELRPAVDDPQSASTSPPSAASSYRERSSGAPYYSSPPATRDEERLQNGAARWRLAAVAFGVVVALGIAAGAWFGLSGAGPPSPPPAAGAGDELKTFTVSAADFDEKATAALKAILAGGTRAVSPAADRNDLRAVNSQALMNLAKDQPQMAEEIASGKRVLYRVYLLDFLADDGDHAELFVNGASQGDTKLKNEGASFLIPLAPGLPAQLKLMATADGGGGVTVAFISSLGEARTRVMQVGEFETWQVIVK